MPQRTVRRLGDRPGGDERSNLNLPPELEARVQRLIRLRYDRGLDRHPATRGIGVQFKRLLIELACRQMEDQLGVGPPDADVHARRGRPPASPA